MKAKEIMSCLPLGHREYPPVAVDASMPVIEVLPRLLDSPGHELSVTEFGEKIGIINQTSMLEGIGKMIAARDDCSIITVECSPEDFSASALAHAVEDTDAHLVDLITMPFDNDKLRVTLRVRHSDPSSAIRSLERYDYHVVDSYAGEESLQELEIATERLLSLRALMNV